MSIKSRDDKPDPFALDTSQFIGIRSKVVDYTPLIGEHNQALLEDVRDVSYGLALHGASDKDIAERYGWDIHTFREQVGTITKQARAHLRILLKQTVVKSAVGTNNTVAHIWAGKQFAGMSDNGLTDDGEAKPTASLFGNLTVAVTHRDENGRTVAEPTLHEVTKAPE